MSPSPPPAPTGGGPQSDRPVLLFDGDCGFCRRWIARWRRRTGDRVEYSPWQEARSRWPDIDPARLDTAVVLVEPDGTIRFGAAAVFRALATAPGGGLAWRWYQSIPAAAAVAETVYRFVAAHRTRLSWFSRLVSGPLSEPPSRRWSRALFLRLLGLVYLFAFGSLALQITGLVGADGILPAGAFLERVGQNYGGLEAWRRLPSLFWWIGAGDFQLQTVCMAGALLGLGLAAGFAWRPVLVLLWFGYLSVTGVGGPFLRFQWDGLLLETGLLAIAIAPPGWRPRCWRDREPSAIGIGLLWWLLFRLMFESGLVKLSSGDPSWRQLTALSVHYETQPLPTWIGWYAHQLPAALHRLATVAMFVIELAVPFLLFAPRRLRFAAVAVVIGLQAGIAATGNYGYFNLLTVVLCLLLVDDSFWKRWLPDRLGRSIPAAAGRRVGPWRMAMLLPFTLLVAVITIPQLHRSIDRRPYAEPVRAVMRWTAPFRSINSYGLFAVMTTTRPEIIVEGSNDGRFWKPYRFRWKPGDPGRRPRFVAPHMPRLDWQMWFAALGSPRSQPWFPRFLQRLLEGAPPVLALLDDNPFPDRPPQYIRATLYHYRFTDRATRRRQRTWWRRERRSVYTPPTSLRRQTAPPGPAIRPERRRDSR